MPTKTATGYSILTNSTAAAEQAVRLATERLNGAIARFGIVFASPRHTLRNVLSTMERVLPETRFIGCTTAGELTERGATSAGIAVMLVAGDEMMCDASFATGLGAAHDQAAQRLCSTFASVAADASSKGLPYSETVLLVDALTGKGDKLVEAVRRSTRPFQQIVGGAAGDEGAFKEPSVGGDHRAGPDSAAALHVFSRTPWGIGLGHGLRPQSRRMTATRTHDAVVDEIDGCPAIEVYLEFARERGLSVQGEELTRFLLGNQLGVYFLDELHHARAPLGVTPEGGIRCAAEIPEGSAVCILDGDAENMVMAARDAAEEARAALAGAPVAGILLFDCICRNILLGERFGDEIGAVRRVFGSDVPIAGFCSYGEIARYRGNRSGWHNTTAVVVAIPA